MIITLIYLLTAIELPSGGSSTVQYITVHYSTLQYSTLQYITVQYSRVQYSTVQYSTVHIYVQTIYRTTQLTNLFGRFSGIRTQTGQTKINDEITE